MHWTSLTGRLPPILILVGHVGLGIAFGIATPIFEGPDEPQHFLFIRYLQVYGRLPVQGTDREAVRAHHPPGYFFLGALLTAWGHQAGSQATLDLKANPRYWLRLDDPVLDNKSLYLHHGPEERWPYRGQTMMVHTARLLSLAFSTATVWLTLLLAQHLRPGDMTFATLAAGLVAFNPMVLFMSGVVQNDTAALAAGAAVLYTLSLFARQGYRLMSWVVVGLVFSVGILLKAGIMTLAAPIALMVLYAAWRAGKARVLVEGGLGVLIPVGLVAGWWLARNYRLYGDWTGNAAVEALWGSLSPEQQWEFLPLAVYSFATGLLGRFGNAGIINFPKAMYGAAGLLALGALGGLLWRFFTWLRTWGQALRSWANIAPVPGALPPRMSFPISPRGALGRTLGLPEVDNVREDRPDVQPATGLVLWAVHGLTVLSVAISVIVFALVFNGGAAGKYLFPAFPSLALLLAAGFLAWFEPRRQRPVSAVVVSLNLGAALYALFGLVLPTYGPPRSPLWFELSRMAPLDADIGGAAHVLGYELNAEVVRPGETLVVTVYWRPEATTDIPYTVFVHLLTPAHESITQRDIYPGWGTYPTTAWIPGRPFIDRYLLRIPEDAPPVSGAKVVLGLYDELTMQRLPVTGADAGPREAAWVEFGNIAVQP